MGGSKRSHSMRAGELASPKTSATAKPALGKRTLMLWQARPHRKPLLTTPGALQHHTGCKRYRRIFQRQQAAFDHLQHFLRQFARKYLLLSLTSAVLQAPSTCARRCTTCSTVGAAGRSPNLAWPVSSIEIARCSRYVLRLVNAARSRP